MTFHLQAVKVGFERDGFYFPVDAMSSAEATRYREQLEAIERRAATDTSVKSTVFRYANFALPFIDELTRLPSILEPVKTILGPDLLVWGANFFTKDAHTGDYVSWHQDLTYWDLNEDLEVTAWVALSPATVESGCMRFVPGTHRRPIVEHRDTFEGANMLSRGQEIAVEVDEDEAVNVELAPGQMSLHHGRLFHASYPNRSTDRRIGLAIRYITPKMRQLSAAKGYATLVAGEDRYGYFHLVSPPKSAMDADALAIVEEAVEVSNRFLYAGAAQAGKREQL